MTGHICRRGKQSWRIKFDAGRDSLGNRKIRYLTVRGKRQDAERELTKQLNNLHEGIDVEPSKITLAEYMRAHLDRLRVSPKTLERYRQLSELQIIPYLGGHAIQKLRPVHIQEWHVTLLKGGGHKGRSLSARTVGHAHRVLHGALAQATAVEIVLRNVASSIRPPRVDTEEVEILTAPELIDVLTKLRGTNWEPIVSVDLGTGLRRGELLGLQWGDISLERASLKVERSVEETKSGLRLKLPKTKHGRRAISLAPSTVDVLRSHLRSQREIRIALGLGRETPDTFVFGTPDGKLLSPDNLSRDWRRMVRARALPIVAFHALRHTHASALIASGIDVVRISRRLGHSSPRVTLTVYAHLFEKTDVTAASAIEVILKSRRGDP